MDETIPPRNKEPMRPNITGWKHDEQCNVGPITLLAVKTGHPMVTLTGSA